MVFFDGEPYLTAREVAKELGVRSAFRVEALARRLRVPTFKILGHGSTKFWKRSDLRLFYQPLQIKYKEDGKIERLFDLPKITPTELGGTDNHTENGKKGGE